MLATVIVEGKGDKQFLNQYFELLFNEEIKNKKIEFKILVLEGNVEHKNPDGELKLKEFVEQYHESPDPNKQIIVIVDADQNKDEYEKIITAENVPAKNIFFFPNNKDEGNLETLLMKIFKNTCFLKCYNNYQLCLEEKKFSKFPDKALTYSYDFVTGGKGKEEERDYKNGQYNLYSNDLKELKKFLEKFFDPKLIKENS